MALIVLVVAWAAFLLPAVLRARAENRPSGSISDFRRQLRVLARTSPAAGSSVAPSSYHSSSSSFAYDPRRVLHAPLASAPVPLRMARSRRAVKRRRDVFVGLLAAMGFSLVLGFLPPLRALWAVHVVLDLLFALYVGMLVYVRNLAAEREMKVRFLPTAGVARQGVGVGVGVGRAGSPEPALVYRRSAN